MLRQAISAEFAALLRAYLHTGDEAELYQASRLGRQLVEEGIGPEVLVAAHGEALQEALRQLSPERIPSAMLKSYALLLEAVMAYGIAYRDHVEAERQRHEQARLYAERLAAQQEELRAVIDHMPDGLVLVDGEGRVRLVNRIGARVLGREPHEVVGAPLAALGLPFADEALYEAQRRVQERGERVVEWEAERDGQVWEVVTARLPGVASQRWGLLLLWRNVTERRALERLREEFLNTVAHDLRAPMSTVFGFSELMVSRDLSMEQMRAYARLIHEESGRLVRLVNNFLDLERLERGAVAHEARPVHLGALCERIAARVAAGPCRIAVEVEAGLPLVHGDEALLAQVLANLVENAIKYSPGGGEVRVAARRVADEVVVAVSDQGLGLPPEALPRLFEKFYRVNSREHAGIQGTGLGLSICRRIVERHGGRIWAQSPGLGQGSTFCFALPVAREREGA